MDLNSLVLTTLQEMDILKSEKQKRDSKYIVEELEFEIGFVIEKKLEGGIPRGKNILNLFVPVTLDGSYSSERVHKIKLKLKPKKDIKDSNQKTIAKK